MTCRQGTSPENTPEAVPIPGPSPVSPHDRHTLHTALHLACMYPDAAMEHTLTHAVASNGYLAVFLLMALSCA